MTPKRDVGGHGGLGTRRYKRYCDAFEWVEHCIEKRYFLEAIAVLDSLICDRLNSRLGFVTGDAIGAHLSTGELCKELLGTDSKPGYEKHAEFRDAIGNIQRWVRRRNTALHATAKVFRSNSSPETFDAIVQSHKPDAEDGVKCLRAFDKVDTASREKVGKVPASYPNAFFPERRGRQSQGHFTSAATHLSSRGPA